ncbi:MAG: hypothetical protein ABL929_05155 [Ferruginibacter sp.]|nr:hypothetical protein [Ferruginibacter sp.]
MKKYILLFTLLFSLNSFAQNVGIGTLTPDKAKLVVDGSATLTQGIFGPVGSANVMLDIFPPKIGFNTYYQGGYKSWITGYSGIINHDQSNGRFTLQTSPASLAAGTVQNFITGLTVDASQNVGIGNITPAYKLDVGGRARYRANVPNDILQSPGSYYDDYRNGNIAAFAGMQDSIRWGLYGSGTGGYGWGFDFNTKTGNVGIGKNATDFSKLTLNGNTALSLYSDIDYYGGISYNGTNMIISSAYSNIFGGIPSKDLLLNPPSCTGLCTFFPGKVGVGVDIPTANFHVGGNMMIGAGSPATGYLVSINGKMICEELKVQLDGAWPDYVFDKKYKLQSIDDLELFIKRDKHLPGIPSAEQVKIEGVEVGDMQKRLLEKIEELTLYLIEINKENKDLRKEVEALKATIK